MRAQAFSLLLILLFSTLGVYIFFRISQGRKSLPREEKLRSLRTKFSDVEYALLGEEFNRFAWDEEGSHSNHQEIVFPLELIIDGSIVTENLNMIQKDRDWLIRVAKKRNLHGIEDINYAVLDSKGRVHFTK